MDYPAIIGLIGRSGSGKDTASRALEEAFGFTQMAFADAPKRILNAFFEDAADLRGSLTDQPPADVHWDDPEWKRTPHPKLFGLTPRELIQRFGTDFGRNLVHESIWVSFLFAEMDALLAADLLQQPKFVVSDCRFVNEVLALKSRGAKIIHIQRPEYLDEIASRHVSEEVDNLSKFADAVVLNEESLERFQDDVVRTAADLIDLR